MTIINPIWFYLSDISDGLSTLFGLCTLVLMGISVGLVICLSLDGKNPINSYIKKMFILMLILGIISIILPDKETCYQMMIASQVTDTNVEKAVDTIKDVTDYIVEKVKDE